MDHLLFQSKLLKALQPRNSNRKHHFQKKETLRRMTLRRQTHLGGNGPFAFTVQIVEGLAKDLL
jgi:hypothetical protein